MTIDELFVDRNMLGFVPQDSRRPVMLVDLESVSADMPGLSLPPCPLIGVGDAAHPFAHRLDAVIGEPARLPALVTSIAAHPGAAAVLVQLLRGMAGQEIETALVHESMAYGLLQAGGEHAAWLAGRTMGAPVPPGEVGLERMGERLVVTMDRPAARNAIDTGMRDGLRAAFEIAALDPDVGQVVLRGAGKAFCVGADLDEFGTTRDPVAAHAIRMATLPAHAIARCRDRMHVHVQGACIGAGLEMAAFAARVTAEATAWFQLPELAMGLIPGAGGCVSVSRRIGRQRAALLILSGRRLDARTALSWGLIDAIVHEDAVDEGRPHIGG